MKALVTGGADSMGMVTVRDLTESSQVSEAIMANDANVENASQEIAKRGVKITETIQRARVL